MKQFALTGGFATGKSTVSRMLEDAGLSRVDADVLTHEVTAPDRTAWRKIVSEFGEEVLLPDRNLDRRKLADIVFNDPKRRKQLESIIHPRVQEAMHERVDQLAREGYHRVILEIPLLFEVHWDEQEPIDAIIVVTADEKTQIERAKKKFGLTEKAIRARIAAQMPLAEKVKKADFVVDNSKNVEETRRQVKAILKKLPKE